MGLGYRHGVAIFSLIIYLPCFFVGSYVALRHGFAKAAGWYFLVIFSLVRTVGACLDLATIANPSDGLITGAAVCSSIGVSPLILACIGFLLRANTSVTNAGQRGIIPLVFRVIGIMVLVGLILSIVGITSQDDLRHYMPTTETKAAILLTLSVWVIVTGMLFVLFAKKRYIPSGEKRLLLAVGISLPFILIRLLYSLIGAFTNNRRFSIFVGDVTIYLFMAVLEEMVVIITCLAMGITLQTVGNLAYRGDNVSESSTPANEEMRGYQNAPSDQSRHGLMSSRP